MKYFIFRNQTIEQLFGYKDVEYSGYGDIGHASSDADAYIWFYQVPPGVKEDIVGEVDNYYEKLQLAIQQVGKEKPFVIFSLESVFNTPIVNDNKLTIIVNEFNRKAIEQTKINSFIKFVDFGDFTRRFPVHQLIDWKFYFISQMVISPKRAHDFAKWWEHKTKELAFIRKKCLILDLDNTLWGGILGEDGIAGIRIGGDYPGKAFSYWQEALLELSKKGVMLAVCSKNNEADVFEAWEKNPFLTLRKEHFVAWRINWADKATNIAELAKELNIGLDSMVFIDDNPHERELIRQMLPDVEVPEFPKQPYELMSFFDELVERYFRIQSLTTEEQAKTQQYKENAQRNAAKSNFSNYNDYLRSLAIHVTITPLNEFNLQRVAQMTQKTNQFNLTTKRYTESDITQLSKTGALIYCMSVKDRFGDSGITGEIILVPEEEQTMMIDTLLLSCRILGKGIEFAFLNTILNALKDKGIKTVKAEYIKTAKNEQVANFYDSAGFAVTASSSEVKFYSKSIEEKTPIDDIYSLEIK